jgi:CheY-like chemotaxis protein
MGAPVLVVDDDPDIRGALQRLLKNAGFEVTVATNGRDALEQVASRAPQLIVLDLMMPEMDGWDFLAATESPAPVIVFSGAGLLLKNRPLPGNVVKVMSKPFEITTFLAAVESYCKPPARTPGS